jgi:hypothetical protein
MLIRESVTLRRCDDGAWLCHYPNERTGQQRYTACKNEGAAKSWARSVLGLGRNVRWDDGSRENEFLSKTVIREVTT